MEKRADERVFFVGGNEGMMQVRGIHSLVYTPWQQ